MSVFTSLYISDVMQNNPLLAITFFTSSAYSAFTNLRLSSSFFYGWLWWYGSLSKQTCS